MTSPTPTSETSGQLVEILSWSGCPSHDDAVVQLERALALIGRPDVGHTTRWIETDDDAQKNHFVGSPSFRIDGNEVIATDPDSQYALGCRVYRKRDQRFSPLPDDLDLRDALRAKLQTKASR